MSKYTVIRTFVDLQDGKHRYAVGDSYPREGYVPNDGRIAELLSPNNRLGVAVIEAIPKKASPLSGEASEGVQPTESAVDTTKAKRRAKKA